MKLVLYVFLALYFNVEAKTVGICLLPPFMGSDTTHICLDDQ